MVHADSSADFVPRNAAVNKKYSLLRGDTNSEVSIFITERLALEFLPVEPKDFLAELYRRYSEKNLLIPIRKKPVPVQKTSKATVFISYSHTDMAVVDQIAERLKQADIAVIRDEESMRVGVRISRFMEQVKTVDVLIAVVSEHSLHSPFVGKEILYALNNDIRLIPCFLDKQFLETGIAKEILEENNGKLQTIQDEITARKNKNRLDLTKELESEEKLRQEFGLNLDIILDALRDEKEISLVPPDTDAGIQKIIHETLNLH